MVCFSPEIMMSRGKVPKRDKPPTKCPSTKTSWITSGAIRHGAKSESERSGGSSTKENRARAIAETFVNRQSSSCVVGKPVSQKRANASSRSLRSQGRSRARRPLRELSKALQIGIDVLDGSQWSTMVFPKPTPAQSVAPPLRSTRSLFLPVRAPVRDLPSARCVHRPTHAQNQGRYS